jgi:multiple sugar transport system ATP-binding protein
MIYVTHDQVEAMTMADKIVVLRAGVIEQVGSAARAVQHAAQPVRRRLHRLAEDEPHRRGGSGEAWRHTIGIRPEHIDVSETEGTWKGTVGVSEHLGSDTFFHIQETGLATR